MIRLDLKMQLIQDTMNIFQQLNSRRECLPKSYFRAVNRTILSDFKKGLKVINKKAGIYVEMPKITPEGNGMFSENYEGKEEPSKEIIVLDENSLIKNTKNNPENH